MTDSLAAAGLNGGRGQVGDRQVHNALHPIVPVNRHLAMGESPYHLVSLAFICGRCGDLMCRTVLDSTPSVAADPNAGFSVIVAPDGRQLDVDSFHGPAHELKIKLGTGVLQAALCAGRIRRRAPKSSTGDSITGERTWRLQNQYSSGSNTVVTDLSHSVMIQTLVPPSVR